MCTSTIYYPYSSLRALSGINAELQCAWGVMCMHITPHVGSDVYIVYQCNKQ